MAKILIVEDEVQDLLAYGISVLRGSYEIIMTERGDEAVELTRKQKPDVIIMDLRLPGELSGIEAIQQIREFSDVPIFALTAYTDLHTRQQALEAGANLFLPKPQDIAILVALVERELEKP